MLWIFRKYTHEIAFFATTTRVVFPNHHPNDNDSIRMSKSGHGEECGVKADNNKLLFFRHSSLKNLQVRTVTTVDPMS